MSFRLRLRWFIRTCTNSFDIQSAGLRMTSRYDHIILWDYIRGSPFNLQGGGGCIICCGQITYFNTARLGAGNVKLYYTFILNNSWNIRGKNSELILYLIISVTIIRFSTFCYHFMRLNLSLFNLFRACPGSQLVGGGVHEKKIIIIIYFIILTCTSNNFVSTTYKLS